MLKLQLSDLIKTSPESLVSQVMENMVEDNIGMQYLSKLLLPKILPLTKDVSIPSKTY